MTTAFNPLQYPIALADPQYVSDVSAWITHIPFGMAAVQMLKPRVLVELGTFMGDSYFAFCQAVAQLGGNARCFAIDSWRGDEHAGHFGDPAAILQSLHNYHDPLYGKFSTLVQSDFDAAAPRFEDNSIDLLHIDGLHTYDAVKHDYETWRPKLTDRAVVIFHDTQVREQGFGVWKLWSEVSAGLPHFEFQHGFGLGVLGVGANLPQEFLDFLNSANQAPELFRQYFFTIGHRIEMYRTAKVMIDGHLMTHRLIEEWLQAQGKGLTALPNPVSQSYVFVKRVEAEVKLLTNPSSA